MNARTMERRILDIVRERARAGEVPRWFEIERRLDIAGDHEALIAAWDARDSLTRGGQIVEVSVPGKETRFRLLTAAETQARMRVTKSGEWPDLEPAERRAVA